MANASALNFCFSSLGCPELGIDSILRLAQAWGLGGVELRAVDGHTQLVGALGERYATPAGMASALAAHSPRIASLDSSLQLLLPADADKAEVLALAPWADALGVRYIRVFDGLLSEGQSEQEGLAAMLRTLDWWHACKRSHRFDCDLMIETHWLLTDPQLSLALAAQAPSPIHLLWDSFHTWRASSLSVTEVWEQLRPYVRHVHFKDGKAAASPKAAVDYCLPGAGDFPLEELFGALAKDGFSGWVSLEWERMWHPHLPPLEEALAAGRRFNWW